MLNNGMSLPTLGIGTYSLHGDVCFNSVYTAIKNGYRHIDIMLLHHHGTDYPYVKASVLVKNLSVLKANLADIVPEDVDNILYKNAIQLFAK